MSGLVITCRCGDCGACDLRCPHGFVDTTCSVCNIDLEAERAEMAELIDELRAEDKEVSQ